MANLTTDNIVKINNSAIPKKTLTDEDLFLYGSLDGAFNKTSFLDLKKLVMPRSFVSTYDGKEAWIAFSVATFEHCNCIRISDIFGESIQITGCSENTKDGYLRIRAVRITYGDPFSRSIASKGSYEKIRNIKYCNAQEILYIKLGSWSMYSIEGVILDSITKIESTNIPETAEEIPIQLGIAQYDINGNEIISTYATKKEARPVGSVYPQYSGMTNPTTLFGGTWENVTSTIAPTETKVTLWKRTS